MTKSTFGDLSTTPASNTSLDGNDVSENCSMAGINNALRSVGAMGKGALTAVATSGTDTYTATLAPVPDAYNTNTVYLVNFVNPNATTNPTLNLNSLGAKTIVRGDSSSALTPGMLSGSHWLLYDGTNFRVLNPITTSQTTPTASGTNTITVTQTPAPSAYFIGMQVRFVAGGTNTGAATLNVNGLGAKNIDVAVAGGIQALAGGEIVNTLVYLCVYDGTQFQLTNPTPQEGSWTPTVAGSSTAGSQTYGVNGQVGRFIRDRNMVWFWARVTMTAKDGATAGNVLIAGLPFTASNVTALTPSCALAEWNNITLSASY